MWLDGEDPYLPDVEGVKYEVVTGPWQQANFYRPDSQAIEAVREATAAGQADMVVIGDNVGAGLQFAEVIAPPLQSRTIVIWNFLPKPHDRHPYVRIGDFRHFGARHKIRRLITKALADES